MPKNQDGTATAYAVEKHNTPLFLIGGVIFNLAFVFIDNTLVTSLFIVSFTGSVALAGMTGTLRMLTQVLGQLIFGPYTKRFANQAKVLRVCASISRVIPVSFFIIMLLPISKYAMVIAFLVMYAIFFFADGTMILPWSEVFSRTLSSNRRSSLMSIQMVFAGIFSVVGAWVIKYLMDSPSLEDTTRYATMFGIFAALALINGVLLSNVRDVPQAAVQKNGVQLLGILRGAPRFIKEQTQYRRILISRPFWAVTIGVQGLLLVYMKKLALLPENLLSSLTLAQAAGTICAGILFGLISRKLGNKMSTLMYYASGALAAIFALLMPVLPPALVFPFACASMVCNGMSLSGWFTQYNYQIDTLTAKDRPDALLLNCIIGLPLSFSAFLMSAIADAWGFEIVFILSACAATAACLIALGFLSPRKIPEYLAQYEDREDAV